jgi:hypothetical protein
VVLFNSTKLQHFSEIKKLYISYMKYLILFEDFDPFAHLSTSDAGKQSDDKMKNRILGLTIKGNDKIKNPYLSLPAGYTCKHAGQCKTMAVEDPQTGKVTLKDYGSIRCYAAFDEVKYPNLRKRNWNNYNLLLEQKTKEDIVELLERTFNQYFGDNFPRYFRVHESGDFFSQKYFDAWIDFSKTHTETIFYAFTTSLDLWVKRLSQIPNNFRITASKGGKLDRLIEPNNLRWMEVVKNIDEAIKKRLPIDINDKLAQNDSNEPFSILAHGGQQKGSEWATDIKKNRDLVNKLKKQGLA